MTETKPVVGAEPATAAAAPANVYDHSTPAAAAETKATDGDVEAQKPAPAATATTPAPTSGYDDDAGKGIGIAMFVVIVVGFCLGWIAGGIGSIISFLCIIAGIVLSSTVTCGCCCGSNLNLNPKVKRWSTLTLLCLVVQWVLVFIGIIGAYAVTASGGSTIAAESVVYALLIIAQILYILAAVFAGIFTWGRKSCGNNA
jgi:hypothetical protein